MQLPGLGARQHQQVIRQSAQSLRLAVDDNQILMKLSRCDRIVGLSARRLALGGHQQRLDVPADAGDGGTQLVRDVDDQLTATLLGARRLCLRLRRRRARAGELLFSGADSEGGARKLPPDPHHAIAGVQREEPDDDPQQRH